MANRVFVSVQEEIKEPAWLKNIEDFELKILDELKYDGQEISILFCDNTLIQQLNNEYRNINSPTDILSFENADEYVDEDGSKWKNMGDMIISIETLSENAKYFEVDENEELKRLLIHGTLHLNGYDHGDEHIEKNVEPTDEMLSLQESLLKKFKDVNLIFNNSSIKIK